MTEVSKKEPVKKVSVKKEPAAKAPVDKQLAILQKKYPKNKIVPIGNGTYKVS